MIEENFFFEGQFRGDNNIEALVDLFRRSVDNINLEISSYCNRRCGYCPVSKVDRLSSTKALSDERFNRVISDLKYIDYAGRVCLNLYNEPTADKELLFKRILEIRAQLPKAQLYFGTNGDYLDPDYVRDLGDAGVHELFVTLHPPPGQDYTDRYSIWRFTEFAARLGVPIKIDIFNTNHTIQGRMTLNKVALNIFSTNYNIYGTDRAGSIEALTKIARQRTSPCHRPFNDFTLSYDGTIFPCCQMFADDAMHKHEYAIGNIDQFPTIFHAYGSESMAGWRRSLLTYDAKKGPCSTCTESSLDVVDVADREMRERVKHAYIDEKTTHVDASKITEVSFFEKIFTLFPGRPRR